MARRRTKSAKQINDQVYRIISDAAERGWAAGTESREYQRQLRRMERAADIGRRYTSNIGRAFGSKDGYIYNDDYTKQVSRRTYMGLANG